ncbi:MULTISPECIES: hypothetical protein [unclassified Helicobacter]|uniref:hypothetical protein n=1 Tax=unclassified Helicobacter TaxID=2593540 RepID=UPI000CF15D93|nr:MULTISPECIES: hypothetical protein [unclassified Helicobacter]
MKKFFSNEINLLLILLGSLILFFILCVVLLQAQPHQKLSKRTLDSKTIARTKLETKKQEHYVIKNGKLPPPKDYTDSKIAGSLTYAHSMQIAKDLYRQKNFQQSLVWSYRAQEIAPFDKEAWILYAKNLRELGYKRESLNILQYYRVHFNEKP